MQSDNSNAAEPRESLNVNEEEDEMRPEYDFGTLPGMLKNGVRGKYAGRFASKETTIQLSPDVAAAFPDSDAVNAALRRLLKIEAENAAAATAA